MNDKSIDLETRAIHESKKYNSAFSISASGDKMLHVRYTKPFSIKNSSGEEVCKVTYNEYVITAWKEGNVKFARLYFGLIVDNLDAKYRNVCINVNVKRNNTHFTGGVRNGLLYPDEEAQSISGHIIPIQQDQNRIYDELDNGSYNRSLNWNSLSHSEHIPLACEKS